MFAIVMRSASVAGLEFASYVVFGLFLAVLVLANVKNKQTAKRVIVGVLVAGFLAAMSVGNAEAIVMICPTWWIACWP